MFNSLKFRAKRTFKRRTGALPDFIIIGAMKCGTTSLYNYLVQHPNVLRAAKKEVHFFDWQFEKGLPFYRSQFPTQPYKFLMKHLHKQAFICGEASPYYLFHPHVARRVSESIPQAKLIVILRNPIDRAHSHYWHWVRDKFERLSFEDAIKSEPDRLAGEREKMLEDETYDSYNYGRFSYLARGRYIEQIKRWRTYFSAEQMLIMSSEDFYADPSKAMKRVGVFLELPQWRLEDKKSHNAGKYAKMDPKIRQDLAEYFKPYNQQLYDYVGHDFGWDR